MADPNDKVAGQVPGRYYVDSQCIDCDLCRETAPANFMRNETAGFSYVYKQPESKDQLCRMVKAVAGAELACIRYRGRDKQVLRLLKKEGCTNQCDFQA